MFALRSGQSTVSGYAGPWKWHKPPQGIVLKILTGRQHLSKQRRSPKTIPSNHIKGRSLSQSTSGSISSYLQAFRSIIAFAICISRMSTAWVKCLSLETQYKIKACLSLSAWQLSSAWIPPTMMKSQSKSGKSSVLQINRRWLDWHVWIAVWSCRPGRQRSRINPEQAARESLFSCSPRSRANVNALLSRCLLIQISPQQQGSDWLNSSGVSTNIGEYPLRQKVYHHSSTWSSWSVIQSPIKTKSISQVELWQSDQMIPLTTRGSIPQLWWQNLIS